MILFQPLILFPLILFPSLKMHHEEIVPLNNTTPIVQIKFKTEYWKYSVGQAASVESTLDQLFRWMNFHNN